MLTEKHGEITIDGYQVGWGANDLGAPASRVYHPSQVDSIGFADGEWLDGDLWCAHSLYVAPKHRGHNLGAWLLLALAEATRNLKGADQRLVPADHLGQTDPGYIPGEWGTTHAALKVWDLLGDHC